jgi:hypothetical protein
LFFDSMADRKGMQILRVLMNGLPWQMRIVQAAIVEC